MPRPHLVLAAAAAALAVSGCSQPTPANDNTNPRQGARTITPPTVLRTPVQVPDAEATAPRPGPDGEDAQADNDEG